MGAKPSCWRNGETNLLTLPGPTPAPPRLPAPAGTGAAWSLPAFALPRLRQPCSAAHTITNTPPPPIPFSFSDWSESPLLGQNTPPPGAETPVYLSVYVERLLDVSEKLYTFDASMLYMLAWR